MSECLRMTSVIHYPTPRVGIVRLPTFCMQLALVIEVHFISKMLQYMSLRFSRVTRVNHIK